MKKQITILLSVISLSMVSCGGWTDKDKTNFIEACEAKSSRAYCDCALEKMMDKFDSFSDIQNDQQAMAEILSSDECLSLEE